MWNELLINYKSKYFDSIMGHSFHKQFLIEDIFVNILKVGNNLGFFIIQ